MHNALIKYALLIVMVGFFTTITFSQTLIETNDSIISLLEQKVKENNIEKEKADAYYLLAKTYDNLNKADLAFKNFKLASSIYESEGLTDKVMEINLQVFSLLHSQSQLNLDPLPYLDAYYNYAVKENDNEKILEANLNYASYHFNSKGYRKSKKYYLDAIEKAILSKNTLSQANINSNLGLLYSGFISQDSARIFFDNALKLYKKEDSKQLFSTYINYANSYQKEENYTKALEFLKATDTITLTEYELNFNKILYSKFANCYEQLGDYEKAFLYLNKYNRVRDSLNITSQNVAISEIKEKFDNEKLRADNLEIESKRKQNKNLLFASIGLLFFGTITAGLIQKNTKKKQLIAEKEQEIQKQKVSTLLKEQEISSINAMINGQEKERQRIANDLHDDLGGLMATVKLQFNTLKEKQTPEMFTKTNALLDEAYQKVRSIAHAKNSGVIAKQGLLKAVKNMANKISIASNIEIEVKDHGLENRLENSLEITIFRIVQELITNIIKHSRATQATINLTNHNDSLNIMIEDNGVGFDTSKTSKKNGMGLHSIEKRVEHLEGEITIESKPKNGTTIIIDIPL